MTGITAALAGMGANPPVVGQQLYTTPGSYIWVTPAGVTKVSVVVVSGGSLGGGALRYINNYAVTPGNTYVVTVGAGASNAGVAGNSWFANTGTVFASGANSVCGGVGSGGTGGGNGGRGTEGGGGAGGYSGDGGTPPNGGAGGGGGAGGSRKTTVPRAGRGGGGGVGVACGQGGSGGYGGCCNGRGGGGGSGATRGGNGTYSGGYIGGNGSGYGGGGGADSTYGVGAGGAVRIVWPGDTRLFPSTCVGFF